MSLSSTIMGLPKNTFQNYLDIIVWELKIIEFFCIIVDHSPLLKFTKKSCLVTELLKFPFTVTLH